jgi:hypothetical protein
MFRLDRLRWVTETSMLKTLAGKHKSTVTKMARKYKTVIDTPDGPRTCFQVTVQRDRPCSAQPAEASAQQRLWRWWAVSRHRSAVAGWRCGVTAIAWASGVAAFAADRCAPAARSRAPIVAVDSSCGQLIRSGTPKLLAGDVRVSPASGGCRPASAGSKGRSAHGGDGCGGRAVAVSQATRCRRRLTWTCPSGSSAGASRCVSRMRHVPSRMSTSSSGLRSMSGTVAPSAG